MNSMQHQQQLDSLVQRASEILKTPGKAVVLDTFVEHELLKVARLESRTGLASGLPLIGFQDTAAAIAPSPAWNAIA